MKDEIREFIEAHVWPHEVAWLQVPFRTIKPELDALRDKVRQQGLWAPHLPQDLGGLGLSLTEFAAVSEALGSTPYGHWLFNCQAPDAGNMELLLLQGTAQQKEHFLRPLAAGDIHSCYAMTEPENAGSNPVRLDTRAVRDGDDYVVEGHKWFTTAADGAAFAVVMAVTDPSADPHRRATQIIVPTDTPGFKVVRNLSVMGEVGDGSMSHAEVRLENCRVPVSNRLGPEGEGFAMAQARLGHGRIHHCMRWIGIAERALDLLCRRAIQRELSPGRPLAAQQTIQDWIADSRIEIDAARFLVLDAAHRIERDGRAARHISACKVYAANMLQRVLDRAIQVHGALGLTDETPLAWWFRHERAARIYDGPDEVHKGVVARSILKQYGVDLR